VAHLCVEKTVNRRISRAAYETLVADARILQEESFGVKVWLLPDERVVKLFRTKRLVSSARLVPYSTRFARNAARLRAHGIPVPEVLETFHCPDIERHGVIYRRLPGETVAALLQRRRDEKLVAKLAVLLAGLHEKGVYFRSVHPGNVLLTEAGSLGLIDLQDVHFRPWPLGQWARARNFRHLFNSDPQSQGVRDFGFEPFVDLYLEALPRSDNYRRRLKPKIMAYDRAWENRRRNRSI
jgi:tRNA A-37 threonylcarbamoyl transferase component Bud32